MEAGREAAILSLTYTVGLSQGLPEDLVWTVQVAALHASKNVADLAGHMRQPFYNGLLSHTGTSSRSTVSRNSGRRALRGTTSTFRPSSSSR
jgi:hypothetical protein